MGIGKRLTYYIEKQGYKKKEFCLNFGFEYNNMVNVLADKRPLGMNILHKVHEALPKLNAHWLLYGVGSEEVENNLYLNESPEIYNKTNDALLKSLDDEEVRKKIFEIIKEK
jgi:hypothetical protein